MNQATKLVCQLDPEGYYIGQSVADLDPMEEGSWLIPAHCIDQPQPEHKPGFAPKWHGAGWGYVPDHRGREAYRTSDGQPVVIETIGDLPAGLTFEPRPSRLHQWTGIKWELDAGGQQAWLVQCKEAKLTEINTAAQAFIDNQTGANQIPAFEIQTWALQAAEAKAWDMDKTAATPVLDRIAASRGIDADKLKAAALRKTLVYEVLTAHVAGQRQALQSKVEAAKTVEALEKITVSFTGVDA